MRIESSSVSYEAAHRLSAVTAVEERIVAAPPARPQRADSVSLSPAAQAASATSDNRDDLSGLDAKDRMAALTVEAMLGRKISWRGGPGRAEPARQAPRQTGEIRQRTEFHAESEKLAYRARGSVRTADGREISFSVSMKLEREFVSVSSQTAPAANAKDPLVVDFGGKPARISNVKVAFDLDSDGTNEQMPLIGEGGGFLVLDANHDGRATDGSELFGAKTGDGFAELARYDADGNGWIDEGDPVFGDLRLWTTSGLSTLEDEGVGAIAVSSAGTEFSFRDGNNVEQARLRSTGVFLGENGTAGTVRQLDLVTG